MLQILNKPQIKDNSLNLIKSNGIYENPTVNVILNDEKRQGYMLLPLVSNLAMEVLPGQ
jgi:hypothetical protein